MRSKYGYPGQTGWVWFRNRDYLKLLTPQNVAPATVPVSDSALATPYPLPPRRLKREED